jgi:putative drug exporter of the RND superfamily
MTGALCRLGGACARHPWRVIAVWLAAIAMLAGLAAAIGGGYRDDDAAPGSSSARANAQIEAGFPQQAGAEAHVVARWPGHVDRAAVAAAGIRLRVLPGVREVQDRTSADGRTAMLVVRYRAKLTDLNYKKATGELTAAAAPLRQAGARIGVGGEVPEAIQGPSGTAEAVGVAAALVILLLAFGSVLAAGLPLLMAAAGLGAGLSLIGLLAAVTSVNSVSPTLGSMIGLGVGIDYALFIVAKYRDRMAAGSPPVVAAAEATATAGRSVAVAGTCVLIGITGLAFSGMPSFATMGVAAALVIVCTVTAAITLLPALLRLMGQRVFGRRARRAAQLPGTSFRSARAGRLAHAVIRRPGRSLAIGALLLIALTVPAASMRLGQNDPGSESPANPTRQAYDLVAQAFGPGANGPLEVVVNRDAVPAAALTTLAGRLAAMPGVAEVSAPALSPDGRTAVLQVIPATGPQQPQTRDLVDRLHHGVLPAGADLTGPTAVMADMTATLSGHLWRVMLAVLAATFALMVIVFRSVVLPAKAVITNLLSVAACYGVMTLAFQTQAGAWLLGLPGPVPIAAWAPIVLFAILFGLSMDYEVFMLSRVQDSYQRTGDPRGAVADGLTATARIITAAAAIMIAVAAGFAFDPSVMVKIIGVGMASAILVDVTIGRLLLVPAAMALLGARNWYLPRWLDRMLTRQVAVHRARVRQPLSSQTDEPALG